MFGQVVNYSAGGAVNVQEIPAPIRKAVNDLFFGLAGKIDRMTNPAHDVLNVSGRQCQTSTDLKPRTRNWPWCQVQLNGYSSFERFPRSWQIVILMSGPSRVADSSLAFF